MNWFWIAFALYLLGCTTTWLHLEYNADDFDEEAKEVISEIEREDDIARATGWMRTDVTRNIVKYLLIFAWPLTTLFDLVTVAFQIMRGDDPW